MIVPRSYERYFHSESCVHVTSFYITLFYHLSTFPRNIKSILSVLVLVINIIKVIIITVQT